MTDTTSNAAAPFAPDLSPAVVSALRDLARGRLEVIGGSRFALENDGLAALHHSYAVEQLLGWSLARDAGVQPLRIEITDKGREWLARDAGAQPAPIEITEQGEAFLAQAAR